MQIRLSMQTGATVRERTVRFSIRKMRTKFIALLIIIFILYIIGYFYEYIYIIRDNRRFLWLIVFSACLNTQTRTVYR